MSILVDKNTRLLVQGITGREGTFHTNQMIAFGTNVVGGVVPGKGGQLFEGTRQAPCLWQGLGAVIQGCRLMAANREISDFAVFTIP